MSPPHVFSAKVLAILLCLAVASCGESHSPATSTAAPVASPGSTLYGVHSDITWYGDAAYRRQTLAAARATGVRVMRIELQWQHIESRPGVVDWSIADDVIHEVTAAGITPLLVVVGSPAWANGGSERDDAAYLRVPAEAVRFEEWLRHYSAFVSSAAQRYRADVRLWEIGNEENDADFWRPAPNVDQYVRWYTALRAVIKAAAPQSVVALGGLNGLGYDLDAPGIRGTTFLKAVYERGVFPEAVAIHPYSNRGQAPDVHVNGAGNFDDIELVRRIMVANGQSRVPIWITEWGWTLDRVTPKQQAEYLQKSLSLLESKYASYVTVATYYNLFDPTVPRHYGLYSRTLEPRPAADVMRVFLSSHSP